MSYAVVGGTFDNLHLGHIRLIKKAFEIGDRVMVCITSDKMVRGKPEAAEIESFEKRRAGIVGLLWENRWHKRAEIVKLQDPFTPGLRLKLTHIVVSPETRPNAEKINDMRLKKGFPPLKIVVVDWVLAEDGQPISDARVRKGEIDSDGRLMQ